MNCWLASSGCGRGLWSRGECTVVGDRALIHDDELSADPSSSLMTSGPLVMMTWKSPWCLLTSSLRAAGRMYCRVSRKNKPSLDINLMTTSPTAGASDTSTSYGVYISFCNRHESTMRR